MDPASRNYRDLHQNFVAPPDIANETRNVTDTAVIHVITDTDGKCKHGMPQLKPAYLPSDGFYKICRVRVHDLHALLFVQIQEVQTTIAVLHEYRVMPGNYCL